MSEFKKKSEKDLIKEVAQMRETLREFRFGIAGSRTRNAREGRGLRKNIARRLTELNTRRKQT